MKIAGCILDMKSIFLIESLMWRLQDWDKICLINLTKYLLVMLYVFTCKWLYIVAKPCEPMKLPGLFNGLHGGEFQ